MLTIEPRVSASGAQARLKETGAKKLMAKVLCQVAWCHRGSRAALGLGRVAGIVDQGLERLAVQDAVEPLDRRAGRSAPSRR
jgi:hypothetical protein